MGKELKHRKNEVLKIAESNRDNKNKNDCLNQEITRLDKIISSNIKKIENKKLVELEIEENLIVAQKKRESLQLRKEKLEKSYDKLCSREKEKIKENQIDIDSRKELLKNMILLQNNIKAKKNEQDKIDDEYAKTQKSLSEAQQAVGNLANKTDQIDSDKLIVKQKIKESKENISKLDKRKIELEMDIDLSIKDLDELSAVKVELIQEVTSKYQYFKKIKEECLWQKSVVKELYGEIKSLKKRKDKIDNEVTEVLVTKKQIERKIDKKIKRRKELSPQL